MSFLINKVVITSITVKLTVSAASKKNDLKKVVE
jgi:flagellar biosynthesis GTPase FlhF